MHGYRDGAVRPVCACARMRRCGRRIVRSRRCRRTTSHVHSWSMRHAATRTWTRIDLFVLSLSPRCGPTGLLRGQGWHALSVLRYTSTSSGLQLLDLGTLISRSSLCARVWRERTCGLRYCIILYDSTYPTKALIAQRSVKVRSRARVSPTPALHDCAVALTPRALPSWQVHGHPSF